MNLFILVVNGVDGSNEHLEARIYSDKPITTEEFVEDYNAAFARVQESPDATTTTEEFDAVVEELVNTGKYKFEIATAIVVMDEELMEGNLVERNVITHREELIEINEDVLNKISESYNDK